MNTYKVLVLGPFSAPNQEGLDFKVGTRISDTRRINANSKDEAIEIALSVSSKGSEVRQIRKVKSREQQTTQGG